MIDPEGVKMGLCLITNEKARPRREREREREEFLIDELSSEGPI